jgi:hypothetical protein
MARGLSAARKALASLLFLATTGCMTYRGPRGAEAVLEERLGSSLNRTFGISLGPISTKLVASFVDDDSDGPRLDGLTGIGVAIFEMDAARAHALPTLRAGDFGGKEWEPVVTSRSGDDQVLLLVKSKHGAIHEMMLVAVESDEVVLARLRGRLDEIVRSAVQAAESDGPRGARGAIGVGASGSARTENP